MHFFTFWNSSPFDPKTIPLDSQCVFDPIPTCFDPRGRPIANIVFLVFFSLRNCFLEHFLKEILKEKPLG
jgi:hypothetical protein